MSKGIHASTLTFTYLVTHFSKRCFMKINVNNIKKTALPTSPLTPVSTRRRRESLLQNIIYVYVQCTCVFACQNVRWSVCLLKNNAPYLG